MAGDLDRPVERRGLAGALGKQERFDDRVVDSVEDLVGPIRRAVRDEDDLEPVARVVELLHVGDLVLEVHLFVVGRDDQGHPRQVDVADRPAPPLTARREVAEVRARLGDGIDDEEYARVEKVRVAHEKQTRQEDVLRQHASALSAPVRGCRERAARARRPC